MSPDTAETGMRLWPTETRELDTAEQFIVRSFRRWITGLRQNDGGHWSLVWNEFSRYFGEADGKAALSGFARLVRGLQSHARRNIAYHLPCCPCLCADEIRIVNMIAACQRRRLSHAHALAEWMVCADGIGDLIDAASQVAHFMQNHGFAFPDRSHPQPATAAGAVPGYRTVH
ncbi:MAG: hypothetical protein O3B08_15670 [Proteobacteria bacterium]|nr:hypothetical protein [Pseudomonadota bacterium]